MDIIISHVNAMFYDIFFLLTTIAFILEFIFFYILILIKFMFFCSLFFLKTFFYKYMLLREVISDFIFFTLNYFASFTYIKLIIKFLSIVSSYHDGMYDFIMLTINLIFILLLLIIIKQLKILNIYFCIFNPNSRILARLYTFFKYYIYFELSIWSLISNNHYCSKYLVLIIFLIIVILVLFLIILFCKYKYSKKK